MTLKKLIIGFLCLTSVLFSVANAKMEPMSEQELASIHGTMDLGNALVGMLQQKINMGQNISAEELVDSLKQLSQTFGVSLEEISFNGVKYGELDIGLIQDGQFAGKVALPSSFERIEIGTIRIGNGASMGSLAIENVQLSGQIKITAR